MICQGPQSGKGECRAMVGILKKTSSCMLYQEIIDMNRNGNLANFFSYVCNGKKSKELFASTLDRIPISVKCVSSMIVVLNAEFAVFFAAHANKNYGGSRRSPTTLPCFAI